MNPLHASLLFALALLSPLTWAHPHSPCPEVLQACGDDMTADLFTRIEEAKALDANSTTTSGDPLSDLVNSDLNNDGCVTVSEWLSAKNDSQNSTFSEIAAFQMISAAGQPCTTGGLNISTVQDVPAAAPLQNQVTNATDADLAFFQNLVKGLAALCEADPTSYTTNCDCAQLPRACGKDPVLSVLEECQVYLAALAERNVQGCVFKQAKDNKDSSDNDSSSDESKEKGGKNKGENSESEDSEDSDSKEHGKRHHKDSSDESGRKGGKHSSDESGKKRHGGKHRRH